MNDIDNNKHLISCQQLNCALELMPKSRHLESIDGKRVLSILDFLIRKCLALFCLSRLKKEIKIDDINKDLALLIDDFLFLSEKFDESLCGHHLSISDSDIPLHSQSLLTHDSIKIQSSEKEKLKQPSEYLSCTGFNEQTKPTLQIANTVRCLLKSLIDLPEINQYFNQFLKKSMNHNYNNNNNNHNLYFENELQLFPYSISYFNENIKWIELSKQIQIINPNLIRFIELFIRLRCAIFTNLLITNEDEEYKSKFIQQLIIQNNELELKFNSLTNKLNEFELQNNLEVQKTNCTINRLKKEIQNLENYLAERIKQIKVKEDKKIEEIQNQSNGEQAKLQKQLSEQKMIVEKLIKENQSAEQLSRSEIYKIESELEIKIFKFDQEMTALQDEYDTLIVEYEEESNALDELEERFRILNEEYQKVMEERKIAEEKRQREEADRQAMEKAVTTIQAFWRSYKTRKLVRGRRGGRKSK